MRDVKSKRLLFALNSFSDLKAGEKDVINIYQVFTDENIGLCDKGLSVPISSCKDKHEYLKELSSFLEGWNINDQLILYYSGHGIEKNNKFYFEFGVGEKKTLYPFNSLLNELDSYDVSRAIIIIDACYSGNITKGSTNFDSITLPKGRILISSSSSIQKSYEEDDKSGSVFTNILCNGLRTGLRNQKTIDGVINTSNLFKFLVKEFKNKKYRQTPKFKIFGADESIWIAKNISGTAGEEENNKQKSISTEAELKLLYDQTSKLEHPCPKADFDSLDWDLIKLFFESEKNENRIVSTYEESSKQEILERLGLYSQILVNGQNKLNKSAVLCFHKYPEKYYPFLKSKFSSLTSIDNIVSLEKEISGPISHQIERFKDLIEDKLNFTYFDERGNRIQSTFTQEDIEVIRELISNAFAHRDYNEFSPVQIGISENYLEIKNPGLFPNGLKWNDIIKTEQILSKPKNSLITYYLSSQLKYEGIGRGFSIIKKYIQKNGKDSIVFTELPGEFTLVKVKLKATSEYYQAKNSIGIKKSFQEIKGNINLELNDFEESLGVHKRYLAKWSSEVAFKDLFGKKETNKIYVDPNFYITPQNLHLDKTKQHSGIINTINSAESNLVILGAPGSGKTTSMKILVHQVLNNESIFKEPILIRLRELNPTITTLKDFVIYDELINLLGLNFSILEKVISDKAIRELNSSQLTNIKKLVIDFIETKEFLIILDGLDEIKSYTLKRDVLNNLEELGQALNKSRIILTSRTGDFNRNIEGFSELEIAPFSQMQIAEFVSKWFNNEKMAREFFKQYQSTPYLDTSISPLILAHLSSIFERYRLLPEKPKTLYKKIINLLLEDWDIQRSISRKSAFANFEIDRKFEFLASLSYRLTRSFKSFFSKSDLNSTYKEICSDFGLPSSEFNLVIDELESSTGLIIQSGYDKYEFSHKSMQEYLCAEYLSRLPSLETIDYKIFPQELAIAISLSSNPSIYFSNVILNLLVVNSELKVSESFVQQFISRITIEKPDFAPIAEYIIALHFLNSILIVNGLNTNNEYFDVDTFLTEEFQPLIHPSLMKYFREVKKPRDEIVEIFPSKSLGNIWQGYILLAKQKEFNHGMFVTPKFLILKKG